jgi:hypothetical protein
MIDSHYPDTSQVRRHEDDCIVCLEPQHCDCTCETCKKSREDYERYRASNEGILDPRD